MTFVNDSFMPAKEVSAVSSAVADDRTATRAPAQCSAYILVTSATRSSGTDTSRTSPRAVVARSVSSPGVGGRRSRRDVGQALTDPRLVDDATVCLGGHDEAGWDREATTEQLAEVRALATDEQDVGGSDVTEGDRQRPRRVGTGRDRSSPGCRSLP